jgi:hypothetical protein
VAAVRYRFRAELRTRWKSIVALALLAGVAGAVALAAVAGARRTDSAFARMVRETRAADVLVNPDFGNDSGLDPRAIARLPMVAASGVERGVTVMPLPIRPADLDGSIALAPDGKLGYAFARPHVLHGRMPRTDRADEVLVDLPFAAHYHVSVGDSIRGVVVARSEFEALAASGLPIDRALARVNAGKVGAPVRLSVVGVGVTPEQVVVDQGFEQRSLLATPAFFRRYPQADAGFFGVGVRLRHGDADLAAFKRAVQSLPHQGAIEFQTLQTTTAKVDRAVQPSVGALTVFAVVLALTALLVVGQAIARQNFLDSIDHPMLRALGFGRGQLVSTSMLRAAVVAILAAAIAVVGAIAASPLLPIGVARTAEPDPGLSVDGTVVGLGALAVVVAVLLLSAASAWWYSSAAVGASEAPGHPSRVSAWLRSSGSPVVAATGVRMALEPGRGRTAVPVRTTMLGAALAIASVVAAVTFAGSLDHLVSTPRLYGWSWDVSIDTGGSSDQDAAALAADVDGALRRSQLVAGISTSRISRLDVDGVTVTTLGVHPERGRVGPTIVAGRAPRAADEIALGRKTLDRVGASVGDVVRVRPDAGGPPVRLRVVGQVVLPGLGTYPGSDKTALGDGALLTQGALRALGPDFGVGPFLVRLAPHATRRQLEDAIVPRGRSSDVTVSGLERPSDIVSYERVRTTPLLLAAVLALLAVATLAHALVTAVRRRRRDLALLKTLGFTRRQVSGAVAWQATTFGVAALVVGVPLGIIVGRWAWTTLADDLGTVAEPIVPMLALIAGVPIVILVANLVAFVPGRIAARLRPAAALRSE